MADESLASFDVKYDTILDKLHWYMRNIILSVIKSSKIWQKSHSPRAFDDKLHFGAISEPTRVPSGGKETIGRKCRYMLLKNRPISFQIINVCPFGLSVCIRLVPEVRLAVNIGNMLVD